MKSRKRSQMSEGKMKVISDLISEYDIKTTKDIQETLKNIMEAEMDEHLGYEKGQITEQLEDIYGFDVSPSFISKVTNKILPEINEWQSRHLNSLYPVVFIDAVHFSVRDEKAIKKLAAYIVLGINQDGFKEVLGLYIGKNESSKYWLSIMNELKNRGVKDILIVCADGLTGIRVLL